MATTVYDYGPGSYAVAQLRDEISAAGLPVPADVQGDGYQGPGTPATHVRVIYAAPLAPGQVNTLDGVVAAHVPAGPRRARLIFDVYNDVGALAAAQKTAVWNDLNAGTPPKWAQDRGVNAPDLHVCWLLNQLGAIQTVADKRLVQQMLISIYVVDEPNWGYLMHPSFAPEIAIDGSEPA